MSLSNLSLDHGSPIRSTAISELMARGYRLHPDHERRGHGGRWNKGNTAEDDRCPGVQAA